MLVIGYGRVEIFVGRKLVVIEKVAVANAVEGIGHLFLVAYAQRLFIIGDGFVVL